MEGRGQIDGDDLVPLFQRKLLDRRHVLHAGIVEQQIQPPQFALGIGDHVGDLVRRGHVRPVIADAHAELLGELGPLLLDGDRVAQAVDDDIRALSGQGPGHGHAYAAGRPGNESDLALENLSVRHGLAPACCNAA